MSDKRIPSKDTEILEQDLTDDLIRQMFVKSENLYKRSTELMREAFAGVNVAAYNITFEQPEWVMKTKYALGQYVGVKDDNENWQVGRIFRICKKDVSQINYHMKLKLNLTIKQELHDYWVEVPFYRRDTIHAFERDVCNILEIPEST